MSHFETINIEKERQVFLLEENKSGGAYQLSILKYRTAGHDLQRRTVGEKDCHFITV